MRVIDLCEGYRILVDDLRSWKLAHQHVNNQSSFEIKSEVKREILAFIESKIKVLEEKEKKIKSLEVDYNG